MFIPDHSLKKIEEGDKVVLLNDYKIKGGVFTRGHEFVVVNKSANGLILQDIDGNIIYNVSTDKVNHPISLEESRNEAIRINNNYKKLSFIKEHCKHRSYAFDEYDKFDSCDLNGRGSGRGADECRVKPECEQYCDKGKMRKLKIKEINK
jgi:hypothetical protein